LLDAGRSNILLTKVQASNRLSNRRNGQPQQHHQQREQRSETVIAAVHRIVSFPMEITPEADTSKSHTRQTTTAALNGERFLVMRHFLPAAYCLRSCARR
jgi:hypothetical protein